MSVSRGSAHLVDVQTMTTKRPPALNALDRCDRCGAQGYIKFRHPHLGELLFCAHHARDHEPALRSQGFEVTLDERSSLEASS